MPRLVAVLVDDERDEEKAKLDTFVAIATMAANEAARPKWRRRLSLITGSFSNKATTKLLQLVDGSKVWPAASVGVSGG